MYSIDTYGRMIADARRMEVYAAALRHTVKPDSVVMDLGCGPGVFALLACKLGARRVYAVEPDSVISVAREAAAANGFANRIEFFERLSTDIAVPEPANIIVSDLRGILPWFKGHIPAIKDARQRLLAPGGVLIAKRDLLWGAVVETPEQYKEIAGPWQNNGFGFDLSAGKRLVTNIWRKARIKLEQLLVKPVLWSNIDYYEVEDPNVSAEIVWRAERNGTAHGFVAWFDSDLGEDIRLSNHPASPELIYGNGLFPFSEPVEVKEGDQIKLRLSAKLIDDDYVWRWDTDFFTRDEVRPKVSFRQSTFYGLALSPALLQKARV